MIEVNYRGRMGNNLFQYSVGRILAEGLGYALQSDPIPGFPRTFRKVEGARFDGPSEVHSGQIIDLDEIIAMRSDRRILLDGYFQHYAYYRPYRSRIREWLTLDPSVVVPDVRPHDVVANVRRAETIQLGWALPFSYYEQAIDAVLPPGGNLWIVTDDSLDPFFRKFAKWRPKFLHGTAVEHVKFMTQAPRLIMSQSSFSWWPAFLGNADKIVCPVPAFGVWDKNGEHPDVDLIEQDRFICLKCPEPYQPTRAEDVYQNLRLLQRRIVLKANRSFGLKLGVRSMI